MRDAILEAVQTQRLDELRVALDLNELKPELAAEPVPDPISYWRKMSGDSDGRVLLALIGRLLVQPFVVQPLGSDPENTGQYVWPAFADRNLGTLTPEEQAHLAQLEPNDRREKMLASGRYSGWRIVIGADGVWHAFRRYD